MTTVDAAVAQVDLVAEAIGHHRFRYANEDMLQRGLAGALTLDGFDVRREVWIAEGCRIDLLVGRVGVEVKVGGSARDVVRQCVRYLESDLLDGLVLVTSRVRHHLDSMEVGDKPVRVVQLAGAGL